MALTAGKTVTVIPLLNRPNPNPHSRRDSHCKHISSSFGSLFGPFWRADPYCHGGQLTTDPAPHPRATPSTTNSTTTTITTTAASTDSSQTCTIHAFQSLAPPVVSSTCRNLVQSDMTRRQCAWLVISRSRWRVWLDRHLSRSADRHCRMRINQKLTMPNSQSRPF